MDNQFAPASTAVVDGARHRGADGVGKRKKLLVPALLMVVGLLIMLYPVVSTVLHNRELAQTTQRYRELDQQTPVSVQNKMWDEARKYNEERSTGPVVDPWLARVNESNPDYVRYVKQLDTDGVMGRLVVPDIKVDLPIYHGTDEKVLQKGVGHLYGSDLPVGGPGTHAVISAHSGLPTATMFDNLPKLKEGGAIYVQVSGHKLKYVVDQIKVVLPNETDNIRPVRGQDYLTLITCTPYGINTHRLLVRSHQVPLEPEDMKAFDSSHGAGWQWWMYAIVAAAVAVVAALAWWLWRMLAASRRGESEEANQ